MKIPDIAEASAIKLFTKEFGTDFNTRLEKFNEECKELNDAITEWNEEPTVERLEHIRDEFSDVQGTFTHLASLMGLYQREMLHNCIDKVKGRKTDPNYKRFRTIKYGDGMSISIIPVPEFDETKAYPKAIKKDNTYYMPDPKFYYNEIQIQDAWKRYFLGKGCKMVKCNQQGIITGNDNESFEPGDHNQYNNI